VESGSTFWLTRIAEVTIPPQLPRAGIGPLSYDDGPELPTRLTAQGFDTVKIDAQIGPADISAVRRVPTLSQDAALKRPMLAWFVWKALRAVAGRNVCRKRNESRTLGPAQGLRRGIFLPIWK